jgi:hypothetical protein
LILSQEGREAFGLFGEEDISDGSLADHTLPNEVFIKCAQGTEMNLSGTSAVLFSAQEAQVTPKNHAFKLRPLGRASMSLPMPSIKMIQRLSIIADGVF